MTSGEYAYLLLRKLQTYVSCSNEMRRVELYNFYGGIFNDPSVVIDERGYMEFSELMDREMDYCARKGYRYPEEIHGDSHFNNSYTFLQKAFRSIGIELTLYPDTEEPSELRFLLPSGVTKVLDDLGGSAEGYSSWLEFHSQLRTSNDYLMQIRSYYLLQNEEKKDLQVEGTNKAGEGTFWTYDEEEQCLEITGNGYLVDCDLWSQLGLGEIKTIIIGAGVNELKSGSLALSATVIDLHGPYDDFQFTLETIGGGALKSVKFLVIYSDNIRFREFDWSSNNIAIEWHYLSEWEEQ